MDVAPRRLRHADTKLYRPPKARPQNEQSRRVEQIVDYVEETLSLKDTPKPTARETRLIVEPQPKHRNKPKKDRRRKPSPKTQPASPTASPQGVESEHRDDATSVEVPIPEERDDGDVIKVELAQRIQGTDDDVSRVSEIIAGKTDCHIISKEGSGVGTYVELLKLMGPYFACTLQEGWKEIKRKVIQTKIPKNSLVPVVEFMHRGELRLTVTNVSSIFVAAEYLQIECLMQACRDFIAKRVDVMFDKAIALGMKYGGMASVAEDALNYVCENISTTAEKLLLLKPEIIMSVLSRDELNVRSEDQVCEIVRRWLQQEPDHEAIRLMIENVRLPHLTEGAFNKLCEALMGLGKLPLIEAVRSNRFAELSEDQLARRPSYDRHIHAVWRESRTKMVPKFFHLDPDLTYRVECVKSRNEKVVSTELLQSFREFRQDRTSFEFVSIMNSLFMITHNKKYEFILIYQQQANGRWVQRIKYRRQEPVPDFALSVFGSELHLCHFDGFNKPLKTVLFQPLSFTDVEVVDYKAPMQLYFSPPRMIFREDFVIYMMESSIEIFDRATNQRGTIKIQAPHGPKATKIKFTDVLVYEDKLYAYEEPPHILRDPASNPIPDRLYVICLKKKEIEAIVDVVFPRFKMRENYVIDGESYRCSKMSIVGSRLVLHKYFSSHDASMIVEFDPEKNVFNKVAEIPNSDGKTYYKKLVSVLPVHLHRCEHETLLQKYCNSVRDPAQAGELDKLLFYL